MGMETAYLGLAIASLASWALTVAEVGIYTWLTLPLLWLTFFLVEFKFMPVPFAKCTSRILWMPQCNGNDSGLWIFFATSRDCCDLSNNATPSCTWSGAKCHGGDFPSGSNFRNHNFKKWRYCLFSRPLCHCAAQPYNRIFFLRDGL